MQRSILALLFITMTLCLGSSQTGAQSTPEDATPTEDFFDVVDVEVANIDVWVTDKQGNSVPGLSRDDFIVYRDGRPAPVTNFYAVSDGSPVPEGGEGSAAGAEAATAGRAPSLKLAVPTESEVAEEHRLWMILYIDNFNADPLERNRVFPALRRFLGQTLRRGDQAMIATYDRSLEVRQPFTDDVVLLHEVLEEIVDDSGLARIRRRDLVDTLERIDKTDSSRQALLYARQYAEERMNGVEYTAEALQRLIDSLGGLPGRKALVHVSSGIPMTAGEEMFHAVAEKFGITDPYSEIPRHDTTRSFERVNRHANAHRVAFYTVDAGGLRGMEFGNAEYGGFVSPNLRRTLDSVVPENLQAPLRLMALETGGRVIVNQNEILPALEKAAQDFRSFYSLGITSNGGELGRYYQIEVKLRKGLRDLRIRHRAGYRSKTTDSRVQESLRSALLYSQQSNPDNVQVSWGRPERQDKGGNYILPLKLKIPLAGMVLLPTSAGKHELRLKLFVGAVDGKGGMSEIDTAPLGLSLADEHLEAAMKESLIHTHKLLVGPGRKKVGVAVLDLFGREASVVTRSVQIGAVNDFEVEAPAP